MPFGADIKRLREKAKISAQKLADITGVDAERLRKWEQRDINPKHEDAQLIESAFGVKIEDFGKLKELPEVQIIPNRDLVSYTEKRRNHKNTAERPDIKVRGGATSLGNQIMYYEDPEKQEVIGMLPHTLFPNCDHAERAKGDSMYPLIMNQALLVGKRCQAKGISYGEKYIIKTKDGLDTTKFVHPVMDQHKRRVPGKILLVAHNKNIPPQEIDMKDVSFACRVHWIINPT